MAGVCFIAVRKSDWTKSIESGPAMIDETVQAPIIAPVPDADPLSDDPVELSTSAATNSHRSQVMSQENISAVLADDPETSTQAISRTSGANGTPGFIPLSESPIAERWQREEGITKDDIATAQNRLRKGGFPDYMVNDPNLVRQFLPRRNVNSVNVNGLIIAGKARAGEPIPFALDGAFPDPSFEFSEFVITREDSVIRIRPIGHSSGEPVPGLEIPVKLKGEIDPLPPGIYHIEFPELGPVGSYELIVE